MSDNTRNRASSPPDVSPATTVRSQPGIPVGVAAAPAAATPIATAVPPKRITGLDMARGLAVLGMMAVHVYPDFNRNGTPSAAFAIAAGRSMATFVLMAGSAWPS